MDYSISNLMAEYLGLPEGFEFNIKFENMSDDCGAVSIKNGRTIRMSLNVTLSGKYYYYEGVKSMARTLIHELTHLGQFIWIDRDDGYEWLDRHDILFKGEYYDRIAEIEARYMEENAPCAVLNHAMAIITWAVHGHSKPKWMKGGE